MKKVFSFAAALLALPFSALAGGFLTNTNQSVQYVRNPAQNAVSGHAVLEQTTGSVVNIEPGYEAVVQGMDRCLVALRDHSLLVCRLDDEQNIKHWIERL